MKKESAVRETEDQKINEVKDKRQEQTYNI